jgi:hypothetical protein
MPFSFNPERVRCSICGQRRRIWGNQAGQRMLGCASCDVHEIENFLKELDEEAPITTYDKGFLAELGVGW